MADFPAVFKPSVNQGYGFNAPNNVINIPTMGGNPIQVLDYRQGPIEIPISIMVSRLGKMVFSDWYFGVIDSGADAFNIELDTGLGLATHVCKIIPGTLQHNGSGDPTWIITMTLRAETTLAQEAV